MRATALLLILIGLPALASEPGQPLDCSDWVSVRPGLTCSVIAQASYLGELPIQGTDTHELRPDNEGNYLRVAHFLAPITQCSQRKNQTRLIQVDGAQEEILGYFENRIICPQTIADAMEIPDPWGNMLFNPITGEARFVVRSFCESCTNWPQLDPSRFPWKLRKCPCHGLILPQAA